MDRLDFAGYAYPVEGLGPGKRLVIWVRGCQRRCAGCLSPELWAPGEARPVEEIAEELREYVQQADGLTISGGEPFDQCDGLAALIDQLRQETDLEVLIYSGYQYEELLERPSCQVLLTRTDILIDGPFMETAANTLQWRGSDNQRVWLLSPRAQQDHQQVNSPMPSSRPLQVQSLGAGSFRIIGIPRRGDMEAYKAVMAQRGMIVRSH